MAGVPCKPLDKKPLTPNGFKDASQARTTKWWKAPDIDLDVKDDDRAALKWWLDNNGRCYGIFDDITAGCKAKPVAVSRSINLASIGTNVSSKRASPSDAAVRADSGGRRTAFR
jgi:hypothetical protein